MRAKLNLLSAVSLGVVTGAVIGCQTYDFEPVDPLAIEQPTIEEVIKARSLKPNVMMLVDTSGSMDFPTQCQTAPCPSRWTALQTAMEGFLSTNGNLARLGLATYPGRKKFYDQVSCGATEDTELHVALPAETVEGDVELQAQASRVNQVIQGISSGGQGIANNQTGGGTPTNASLRFLANNPGLQGAERADFILLLTDGLPNCNPDNPHTGPDTASTPPSTACRCTQPRAADCDGILEKLGCLDKDGSVGAIRELQQKGIKTIVIGFGAETATGDGPETLNAMAEAGGFARQCPAGSTNCQKFYKAETQAELATALKDIIDLVGDTDVCLLPLSQDQRPTSDKLMVVYINGESLEPGPETWSLTDKGVQFNGAACKRIKDSTVANPVNIEVRVVRPR
jgi:hypothetical protein